MEINLLKKELQALAPFCGEKNWAGIWVECNSLQVLLVATNRAALTVIRSQAPQAQPAKGAFMLEPEWVNWMLGSDHETLTVARSRTGAVRINEIKQKPQSQRAYDYAKWRACLLPTAAHPPRRGCLVGCNLLGKYLEAAKLFNANLYIFPTGLGTPDESGPIRIQLYREDCILDWFYGLCMPLRQPAPENGWPPPLIPEWLTEGK